MNLILTEQGCHTWVVTAAATGPILAINGHRLEDPSPGGGGGAARASSDASTSTPELPLPDTSATLSPEATGDLADPTITTRAWVLPGTSFGVLEIVRIGPLPLSIPASDTEPQAWADTHFAAATLAHSSRNRRVQVIAAAMATHPGRSIPQLFTRWYDVKAAYDVFNHPEATPDHIQAGHRRLVRDLVSRPGEYLLIEDTTAVSYHGRKPIKGLGSVGHSSEGQKAFHLHSVLAVGWSGLATPDDRGHRPGVEVLGLLDQQSDIRSPSSARDRPQDRRAQGQGHLQIGQDLGRLECLGTGHRADRGRPGRLTTSAGFVSAIARPTSTNISAAVAPRGTVSSSARRRTG